MDVAICLLAESGFGSTAVAGRNSLGELVLGDRRVLYSRALSGRIPATYIEAVRAQVQGAVVLG